MKVKDLMTPQPTVIRPEDMVSQAATLMKQEDCGAIPVVAKDGKLVGIVTDRDIVIRAVAAGRDPRATPVSAVMCADPVTLSPDASADDAEKLMADRQVRRLPVVAGGHLVGLLVTAQLARRGDAREVGETIKGISEAKSGKGSPVRARSFARSAAQSCWPSHPHCWTSCTCGRESRLASRLHHHTVERSCYYQAAEDLRIHLQNGPQT